MKPLLEIKLAAKLENLETLVHSVTACAKQQGVSENTIPIIELVIEEAFVNICNYAYPEGAGEVEITCILDNDRFTLEITDEGIPFDINSVLDPDITQDISERKIGGLGVFFMNKMADTILYRREGNRNILRIAIAGAEPEQA